MLNQTKFSLSFYLYLSEIDRSVLHKMYVICEQMAKGSFVWQQIAPFCKLSVLLISRFCLILARHGFRRR